MNFGRGIGIGSQPVAVRDNGAKRFRNWNRGAHAREVGPVAGACYGQEALLLQAWIRTAVYRDERAGNQKCDEFHAPNVKDEPRERLAPEAAPQPKCQTVALALAPCSALFSRCG